MKNLIILIGWILLQSDVMKAQQWQVYPVDGLNSAFDEFPAFNSDGTFYFYSNGKKDILHEEDWKLKSKFEIHQSSVITDYASLADAQLWNGILGLPKRFDYVCPSFNHNNWIGIIRGHQESVVYSIFYDQNGNIQSEERGRIDQAIFHLCAADTENDFIASFQSKEAKNKIDLALLHLDKAQITIVPIQTINSNSNEVFPYWNNGDLYFSSDRDGDLDLFVAYKKEQWAKVQKLAEPLNSEADDHSIYFLNETKGFIASNRGGGKGGDDLYVFERIDENALAGYKGRISVKDKGLRGIPVSVYNELGELIAEAVTGRNGEFDFPLLTESKNFKVMPTADPRVLANSRLQISNPEGVVVQEVLANSSGYFYFEFLPYLNPGGLKRLENPDESTLFGIRIGGKVLKLDSSSVDEGELIILMNDSGDLQQIAYIDVEGAFKFEKLSPKAKYSLGVEEGSEANQIMIDGASEPISRSEDGLFDYQRIAPDKIKRLQLSDGSEIEIQSGELLKLNDIEYAFNQWQPDQAAKDILTELAALAKLNPGIQIDLKSHTDSRGTSEYNLELSKKRANAAVEYLKSIGMSSKSVFGTGLGESNLLNECDDARECSEEKHAENRRTEVIIRMD